MANTRAMKAFKINNWKKQWILCRWLFLGLHPIFTCCGCRNQIYYFQITCPLLQEIFRTFVDLFDDNNCNMLFEFKISELQLLYHWQANCILHFITKSVETQCFKQQYCSIWSPVRRGGPLVLLDTVLSDQSTWDEASTQSVQSPPGRTKTYLSPGRTKGHLFWTNQRTLNVLYVYVSGQPQSESKEVAIKISIVVEKIVYPSQPYTPL